MIKLKPIQHDVSKYLPRISEMLSRHPEVVAAYIFGSYASGEVGPLREVDISYLFDPEYLKSHDPLELDLQISAAWLAPFSRMRWIAIS